VRKSTSLTVLALSVLAAPLAAQIGSVVRAQKLNELHGGLVGPISRLGFSLAALGDVNGDGVGDLVAGLPLDNSVGPQHGALLVLFLNPDGTVAGQQKISESVGGFTGSLMDYSNFGFSLATLGDVDGDGVPDLAVRAVYPLRIWILLLNANGTVRAQQEILATDPVYGGAQAGDFFAHFLEPVLAGMGDLDGDGVGDLAVGAPEDDDGGADAGALWLVYLNSDGTAKAAKKIAEGSSGFTGDLLPNGLFGYGPTRLGDVDGDGFVDLSVAERQSDRRWVLFLDGHQDVIGTALLPFRTSEAFGFIGDLDGDGIAECASDDGFGVWFLAADGHLRKQLRIAPGLNGMPLDPFGSSLGEFSFASLGDLDGDGAPEVAVSDAYDTESGGAVWILSLARTPVRNGSGANPLILGESAEPALGQTWSASLDCSGHASGFAALVGHQRASAGTFVAGGELLVDPSSPRFFLRLMPHAGAPATFSAAVPNDASLVSVQLYAQGLCGGAPGLALSNGLGLLIGG